MDSGRVVLGFLVLVASSIAHKDKHVDQTNPGSGRELFVCQHRDGENMGSEGGAKDYPFLVDIHHLGHRIKAK